MAAVPCSALAWLAVLADPEAITRLPAAPLDDSDIPEVLHLAERHGVLPAVVAHPTIAARSRKAGDTERTATAIRRAEARRTELAGFGLSLAALGVSLNIRFQHAGVPAVLVKGPAIARRCYPAAGLRTFSDLDFLLPKGAMAAARTELAAAGLAPAKQSKRPGYAEERWFTATPPAALVELHFDMVDSPKLRRRISFRHEHAIAAGTQEMSAEAMLVLAAIHGATSHQFDRLQHVVDVLLLARGRAGRIDPGRLIAMARRTGALLCLATVLRLGREVFDSAECAELLGALPAAPMHADRLIGRATLLGARSANRWRSSWRRQLFRVALLRLGPSAA